MSDDIDWEEYRARQRHRRTTRLPVRTAQIEELRKEGFVVRKLSEYQFRINERLDIYPIHHRYHDTQTGRRGGFPDISQFVRQFFGRKRTSG